MISNNNIYTEENIKLIEKAYEILEARDPEFKSQWDELRHQSLENLQNSPILKQKAVSFALKYDHILAEEIKKMI